MHGMRYATNRNLVYAALALAYSIGSRILVFTYHQLGYGKRCFPSKLRYASSVLFVVFRRLKEKCLFAMQYSKELSRLCKLGRRVVRSVNCRVFNVPG
jgi:hypothetical protein